MSPQLFILIPVHNRKEITRDIVRCLRQQTFQNYHLLLIDDGSTDGTAEMVCQQLASVTVLRGNGNWWWAGSLHQGYLWLKQQQPPDSTMVLVINDDTTFDPNYLELAVAALRGTYKTLIVSHTYSIESQKLVDGGIFVDWKHWKSSVTNDPAKINCASTRGLFLYVSDFLRLGGFYPTLLPHYTSDYEFTIRAHRRGYSLKPSDKLILHVSEKTSGIYNFKDETSYIAFLKHLFSKRYTLQPIYLTNYIALACPWRWKIKNWLHVWLSTGWKIVRFFFIINFWKPIKRKYHERYRTRKS
jgi:GT2 family glycosyltransferase